MSKKEKEKGYYINIKLHIVKRSSDKLHLNMKK